MRRWLLVLACAALWLVAAPLRAQDVLPVPALGARVIDQTNTLGEAQRSALEEFARQSELLPRNRFAPQTARVQVIAREIERRARLELRLNAELTGERAQLVHRPV